MASTVTVKAYLTRPGKPDEIRRFAVDENVSTSYDYLVKKIGQVFQDENNMTLAWKDVEGDLIVFSSDDELVDALGFVTDAVFRIYIKSKNESDSSNLSDTVHPSILCDGCNQQVVGVRYKCLVCADYDLCGACEGRGTHSDHEMIRLRNPVKQGWKPPGFGGADQAPSSPMTGPPGPPFGCPPGSFAGPPGGHPYGGPPFGGPPMHLWGMIRRFWRKYWRDMQSENSESEERGKDKGHKKGRRGKRHHGHHRGEKVEKENKAEGEKAAESEEEKSCESAEDSTSGVEGEDLMENSGPRRRCGRGGRFGPPFGPPWARGGGGWGGRGGRCPRGPPWWPGSPHGTGPSWAQFQQQQLWGREPPAEQTESIRPVAGPPVGIPMASSPAPCNPDSDWTMLNKDKDLVMDVEERSSSPPEGIPTQMTPINMSLPLQPSSVRVQKAVDHLKSMGFSNDGGWLTQLVESREGDINKVLDALRPHQTQQGVPAAQRQNQL